MTPSSLDLSELSSLTDNISLSKKLELIEEVDLNDQDQLSVLYSFLESRILQQKTDPDCIDGTIYKLLVSSNNQSILDWLDSNFKYGFVDRNSKFYTYYFELQHLLIEDNFQQADICTAKLLCTLANLTKRNWLYFSDVRKIPQKDLHILDNLWKIFSKGKFGFSIQRQIWLNGDKDWNLLWDKIGWRQEEVLCRYPEEFIWDLSAPAGHLPLSNQLRGVQTLNSLFGLSIWK
nr:Ycf53 [Erythrocladia irregularis]